MRWLLAIELLALISCSAPYKTAAPAAICDIDSLAVLADGWSGQVITRTDQSYVGWDVEIGDADNDGLNEILTTGCPDSRLYLCKKIAGKWQTNCLAADLARRSPNPGMGLSVKVVDLNADGINEIILGTGQETMEPAYLYVLHTDGKKITKKISSRPFLNGSPYTHNLAMHDLDGDGIKEIISAYCGSGEITRYDFDKKLTRITPRTLHQLSGSGEDSFIADVDNDRQVEYITCNSYRVDQSKVEIFEFDSKGELILPPKIVIDGFDDRKCFNCSIEIGDVDNDGKNELVIGWKTSDWKHGENNGTIIAYRVDEKTAKPIYTFAHLDPDLDLGYFEKMMCIADADNDSLNELIVTTRGERRWKGGGLGHVFMYKVLPDRRIQKTLIANFHDRVVDACWPAVGDADNDGKNEIVIATGAGNREKSGESFIVLIEKN